MKKRKVETSLKKRFLLVLICVLEFLSLIYLYSIKYRAQSLTLSNLDVELTGNILNLIFSAAIILTLLFLFFFVTQVEMFRMQILVNLSLFSFVPLILNDFFIQLDLHRVLIYMLGFAPDKIFRALFFIIFQITKFVLLFNVIFLLMGKVRNPIFKSVIYSFILFILILVFSFISTLTLRDNSNEILKPTNKFNAVLIPGAAVWSNNRASPILLGRLRKANQLYRNRFCDKIIVTGANAPGEMTEADVSERELLKMGVPKSDLIKENKTTNTLEQIYFLKNKIQNEFGYSEIIVVSDQFHLRRISEMAKFHKSELSLVRSDHKIDFITGIWFRIRDTVSLTLYWLFGI